MLLQLLVEGGALLTLDVPLLLRVTPSQCVQLLRLTPQQLRRQLISTHLFHRQRFNRRLIGPYIQQACQSQNSLIGPCMTLGHITFWISLSLRLKTTVRILTGPED